MAQKSIRSILDGFQSFKKAESTMGGDRPFREEPTARVHCNPVDGAQSPASRRRCGTGRGVLLLSTIALCLVGVASEGVGICKISRGAAPFPERVPRSAGSAVENDARGGARSLRGLRGGAKKRLGWATAFVPAFTTWPFRRAVQRTNSQALLVGDSEADAKQSRPLVPAKVSDEDSSEVDQAREDADPNQVGATVLNARLPLPPPTFPPRH